MSCNTSYGDGLTPYQFKTAHRELREAIKKGTGYIEDLPPFLYIEYALCCTALGDLMVEYEIAAEYVNPFRSVQPGQRSANQHVLTSCSREAAGFRLLRLWMWILADDAEYETAVQEVVWEDPEE